MAISTLEVWNEHPNQPHEMLEKWELKGGEAVLVFCKRAEPMYHDFGDTEPSDGEKFLNRLRASLKNSTYLSLVIK